MAIPLQRRFIISMGIMLLPLVVLATVSIFALRGVTGFLEEATEEISEEIAPVRDLQLLLLRAHVPLHNYLVIEDLSGRQGFLAMVDEIDVAFARAHAAPFAKPEKRLLVSSSSQDWQAARFIGLALLDSRAPVDNEKTASREINRFDALISQAVQRLDRIYGLAHQELNEDLQNGIKINRTYWLGVILIFTAGFSVAVFAAVRLARSVLRPVRALQEGVAHFGGGDLSYHVMVNVRDELGQLAEKFNEMAARLEYLAVRDGLTGLYNHREFYRRLELELARSRRYRHEFSLLMVDVDHFKTINDTYGHQAGDRALQVIASLLQSQARHSDQAARYGGEEFVLILPEAGTAAAQAVAERILESVAERPIAIGEDRAVPMTVSIGVANFPRDADQGDQLVAAADEAMYAAKRGGRNRIEHFKTPGRASSGGGEPSPA